MNYRERGRADIRTAELLISSEGNPQNDEALYDVAAFHVQQGIEKELKYVLHDIYDEDDETRKFRTHDLTDLIDYVEIYTDIVVSDEIKEIASDLTDWESNSRYGSGALATIDEIKSAIEKYENMSESIDEQIDDLMLEDDNVDIQSETVDIDEDDFDDYDDYDPID